ncbi:E3 ubiquitin-protein ligase Jade-2 isoform X2 [Clupea harengus]|nr:E3 ubiquitin-protein ligase Jade-2 isoform X2 [Clupea harengus]XP_031427299.1 E3 ubiquitin-protein ligase Jade-2 isoform X2 [Clupea harengus]XP_031427300.1 E3 ubiquitin-protein ligase Jade-2 isoform X2 [Clupea harengus]
MESVVKKRRKYSTSSNDSDTTDSHVTSWSKSSKTTGTNSTWVRQEQRKPSEVFRTDFITAMKLPDSAQLGAEDFYVLSDPWRQEWEKGVQVPANMDAVPDPVVRMLPETNRIPFYSTPHIRLHTESDSRSLGEPPTRYDLDDLDVAWLELVNTEFRELALPELDELSMERALEELERQCQEKMQQAIETEEGLGIEYDEDVVCDVCRSPEGEDGNEMVFCDKCNICVHQACYGILKVPQGNWLCRTCALGVQPKCLLCPKRGGALKPTRSGTKWVHVSCALWIPEVSIGCPEKMEPITKVSHIPASRWALSCSLCREHTGTCIQCSMPSCVVAFHVTCAFDHGLEMHTILAENDEVRFKSYCLEHSYNTGAERRPEHRPDAPTPTPDRQKASQRKQKLQELEDEFYRLVEPKEVADKLGLPDAHVDFLYQFWKLRRKSNLNKPLVAAKRDEVDNLAQQEQDVLYRRLKLFTHLRQDLERVRNLCYMVTRREKMKHSLCDLQEKIFQLQIQLMEKDLAGDKTLKGEKGRKPNGVKERSKERRSEGTKERWKSDNGSLLRQLGVPLDGSLFDSWLAQPVQITADDMLSRWTLDGERRDTTASLLSHQLLQGEQNLLNLMMDHSMQSAWKTPQLGRKARTKPRARAHKDSTSSSSSSTATGGIPAVAKGFRGVCEEGLVPGHAGRHGERLRATRTLLYHHHHHTRHGAEAQPEPLQPPTSKMDSCHISDERGPWHLHAGQSTAGPEPGGPASAVPEPPESAVGAAGRPALRPRLTRQGKSRSKGGGGQECAEPDRDSERPEEPALLTGAALMAAGANGFFSDAERSANDSRPTSRKLRLGQLLAGNEEVLRRSVLAS